MDDTPTADTATDTDTDAADSNAERGRDSVVVPEDGGAEHPGAGHTNQNRWNDQPTVQLPSGDVIPAVGIGTWQLEGSDAIETVEAALELGVRHVDTAQMYDNEAEVGRALARSGVDRDDVFLTTKVANDRHEPAQLVDSIRGSLERLDTDHVDLLLLHWPVDFDRIGATLSSLAQVQASGLARHVGVSNFTIGQLEQTHDFAPIEVVQCECHPFLQQTELRNWCNDRDWAFTAYSPLARGDVFENDTLDEIATNHDATSGQVALAWLLAQPDTVVIPKTSDRDHLADNWAARELLLDESELDRIGELDEGRRLVDPDFAPW